MDVDTIPAGQDFREVIRYSLDNCDVAIIVIGKEWLGLEGESGPRRIDNPADYLRLEVETVLSKKIPVIPLLVGGAQMPTPSDLPETVADLAYRHAIVVRPGRDFDRDIDTLISDISRTTQFHKTLEPKRPRSSAAPLTDASDVQSLATSRTIPSVSLNSRSRPNQAKSRLGTQFSCLAYYFVSSVLLVFFAYVAFAAVVITRW